MIHDIAHCSGGQAFSDNTQNKCPKTKDCQRFFDVEDYIRELRHLINWANLAPNEGEECEYFIPKD